MATNRKLTSAKRAKNDEFYTHFTDIEKELESYKGYLKDKVIFCNCDDPERSNFWRYFDLNFDNIGIKALMATHYDPEKPTYKLEIRRDANGNKLPPVQTELNQNGDFRSPECVKLLQECDVVVTNPPFSLFREYVAQLMQYGKKFVIIGNMNAITYKEIFPLIKENRMWVGANSKGGSRRGNSLLFSVPEWFESECFLMFNGERCAQVSAWWFTNIDLAKRHEPLMLVERYYDDPSRYPKYDNYDAINCDVTETRGNKPGIPKDYFGYIGVPISFLDKYCLDQFEIVGTTESEGRGFSNGLFKEGSKIAQPMVNGKKVYKRLFIRRKEDFGFKDDSYREKTPGAMKSPGEGYSCGKMLTVTGRTPVCNEKSGGVNLECPYQMEQEQDVRSIADILSEWIA